MNEKVALWIQAVSKSLLNWHLEDEEYKLLEDVEQYGVSELATVIEVDSKEIDELKEIILKGATIHGN